MIKGATNKIWYKNILILIFIFSSVLSYAQAPKYNTWLGLSYNQKLKIKKFKFKFTISQGLRIKDLMYNTRYSALTELGFSTKATKFYKIGLSYRASYIGKFKNRIALSNTFKIKLSKKIDISFRVKYQMAIEKSIAISQAFREKTTLKWDAHKDIRPYVFGEILYNYQYNYSNFNEYRLGIGIDADIKKKHGFDILLMYLQEINLAEPQKAIVLGLTYEFSK